MSPVSHIDDLLCCASSRSISLIIFRFFIREFLTHIFRHVTLILCLNQSSVPAGWSSRARETPSASCRVLPGVVVTAPLPCLSEDLSVVWLSDALYRVTSPFGALFGPPTAFPRSNHYFACCWHCSSFQGSHPWLFFFDGSLGPWLFFFHGSLGPVPGCFPFFTCIWHVFRQTFHSPSG